MPTEQTRARLLQATARVIKERGLTGTTIREIAREAGVAEGALYRHFPDKVQLIRSVVVDVEEWPRLGTALSRLLERVGEGTVRDNLETLVREAVEGYSELIGWTTAFSSDQEVLDAVRDELAERDIGPARAHDALVTYLTREADQGRVELASPPAIVSAALLGACHERAFLQLLHRRLPFPEDVDEFAHQLVSALGKWDKEGA